MANNVSSPVDYLDMWCTVNISSNGKAVMVWTINEEVNRIKNSEVSAIRSMKTVISSLSVSTKLATGVMYTCTIYYQSTLAENYAINVPIFKWNSSIISKLGEF